MTSTVLAGPFFLAAAILAVAGFGKIRRPQAASRALEASGLPSRWRLVRGLGAVEVILGVAALVLPRPPVALALAGIYLAFAAFLISLLASGAPEASCGCAGSRETPPSILHVVLDLFAAAAAVGVALEPVPDVLRFALGTPFHGVPLVMLLAVTGYVAALATSHLSELRLLVARCFRIGHDHGTRAVTPTRPAVFHVRDLAR